MDRTTAPALSRLYLTLSKPPRREWVRPRINLINLEYLKNNPERFTMEDLNKIAKMGGVK